MVVVVEGIDRVGKTTFVKKLEKLGFISLKDEFVIHGLVDDFKDYSIGKCESFVKAAQKLDELGYNVVIDRLHLTEYVYGVINRKNANVRGVFGVDMMLANLGAILCYIRPADINLSNELAGCDQTKMNELFEALYNMSSMTKFDGNFNTLDDLASYIVSLSNTYDFYFASPFFNEEQVEREERMIEHLRSLGFRVFSPKESCHLDAKASQQSREEVFRENCLAIKYSKAVFAVTDGKDMGTIWEAGYAYGINKPVIYYAETLRDNQFNLMLAQSGRDVFMSQDEVTFNSLTDALDGNGRKYRGDIE